MTLEIDYSESIPLTFTPITNISLKRCKVHRSHFAVLLINMQATFLNNIPVPARVRLIAAQIKVLKFCAEKNIPVVVLEYTSLGTTIPCLIQEVEKVPVHIYVTKYHDSGFQETILEKVLFKWCVNNLCFMGINSFGCVRETAIGALSQDQEFKIFTAQSLIESPKSWTKQEFALPWFRFNGTCYRDYRTLLKRMSVEGSGV